jgi:hypothetical protein
LLKHNPIKSKKPIEIETSNPNKSKNNNLLKSKCNSDSFLIYDQQTNRVQKQLAGIEQNAMS